MASHTHSKIAVDHGTAPHKLLTGGRKSRTSWASHACHARLRDSGHGEANELGVARSLAVFNGDAVAGRVAATLDCDK